MASLFRRRQVVAGLAGLCGAAGLGLWAFARRIFAGGDSPDRTSMEVSMIQTKFPLDFQWRTQEPFLFCVHHYDLYPKGEAHFGPPARLLKGRDMGQDFEGRDGFRMYHGEVVPGFPVHPHRGFETITIVRKGYVDHADSLGAAGRYGEGDVQWMTAGAGVQHSEMFPLLSAERDNTMELFQIWLNLPKRSKMVPPHFAMFWSEKIPRWQKDGVDVRVIAGSFAGLSPLAPPPDSWAADPANEVSILLVKLQKGGRMTIPPSREKVNRTLYAFEGGALQINQETVGQRTGVILGGGQLTVEATEGESEFLWLQAKPIGEPLVQHGPFVMNSREEIVQAFQDYQRTQFGGWPWPKFDMVHGTGFERFAKFPNGRVEKPEKPG